MSDLFRNRCTVKAMGSEALPCVAQSERMLAPILDAAAWAPFHKPAAKAHRSSGLEGIEPWRCYVLDAKRCRTLRKRLLAAGDATKIPKMLAVAVYLIQVTWLPDTLDSAECDQLFEPSIQNMEHIAAASAAIQNMLLAATEEGIPSYWSSGGKLRSPEIFEWLEIPENEVLLGSIFLFPKDLAEVETKAGALRDSRSDVTDWSRFVEL